MNKANNLTETCKKLYESREQTTKSTMMMAKRYLVSAAVLDNTNFYHTAFHTVKAMLSKNPSDISLALMQVYLNICLGNYESADKQLNALNGYKTYFKLNEPVKYGIILYLQSLNEYRTERNRPAYRYFKTLKDFNDEEPNPEFLLMLGELKIEFGETEEAGAFLAKAYDIGLRSPFLFLALYKYFGTLYNTLPFTDKLLIPFLSWGLAHDVDLSKIIEGYMDKITLSFFNNTDIGVRLYRIYPATPLLREICKVLINDYDYSERAHYFYMEAMLRQVELHNLNDCLVKSSFRNNKEKLNVYTLKQFLKSSNLDMDLKPYIYHILLSNKKYDELVSERHLEIIRFGVHSLTQGRGGRYYNSIYKYILDNEETAQISEEFIALAEEKLYKDLLSFEITVKDDVDYIWINEKEKGEMEIYEVKGKKAIVKAASSSFQYYPYKNGRIASVDADITKLIQNEDMRFYVRCYSKQHKPAELLIVLSKYCLRQEEPPVEVIGILKETADTVKISRSFRMKIIAAIGNIYYNNNKNDKAVKYYKMIDENYLNDRNIDQMVNVLTEAGELEKVINIIIDKADCLSDRTLFYAVKTLSKNKEYHGRIANASYELLLKSWYDRMLIDIVLEHYKGGQEEWQQLSSVLNSMGIQEKSLDELIIKNGIWMHRFDTGIQQVFKNVYEFDCDNECIKDFVTFCSYEVLVNKTKIQFETVSILEKIFLENKDRLLSFTLSHIYIEQGLNTLNSAGIIEEAVSYMEKDGILFPVFKESKDKSYSTPYIEKNHPFIYRSVPGKEVVLNLRVDGEVFRKRMKYVAFGFYMTAAPHFYNEEIESHISEEMPTGSIETRKQHIYNSSIFIHESSDDPYFDINNAVIYDKMFKYDRVEQIITEKLKEGRQIRGRLL